MSGLTTSMRVSRLVIVLARVDVVSARLFSVRFSESRESSNRSRLESR
ncbi:Uncharacterised protein [Mycobacteroides abscessus subsp. abscessus]|nr:Uncharacterised protein [Mycobacteroides abscessus subsp. abscessus]